jgi:hypothetical protein
MEPPTYASEAMPTTHVRMPIPAIEKHTGIRPSSAQQPSEPPPGTPTLMISAQTVHDLVAQAPSMASQGLESDTYERTIIAPPDFALPSAPAFDDDDIDEDDGDGATMMLAAAAIVIIEPASMSQEFQLGAVNGIGRSEDNQICLLNPGISRIHAVIKAVPGGYSITDLGSQNGTFVNGQRVTEKALTDGDTIDVGSVQFVFRMPWAPSATASAGRSGSASRKR